MDPTAIRALLNKSPEIYSIEKLPFHQSKAVDAVIDQICIKICQQIEQGTENKQALK